MDYDGVKALAELYIWQLQREDVAGVVYAVESDETRATLTKVGFSSWMPFYPSVEEARKALEEA